MSAGSVVIGCFRDPAGGALVAGDVIVVVDVVRATTTAVTAVAQGRRCFTAPTVGTPAWRSWRPPATASSARRIACAAP